MANQNFKWNLVSGKWAPTWKEDWNVAQEEAETSKAHPTPALHDFYKQPEKAEPYGDPDRDRRVLNAIHGLEENRVSENFAHKSEATSLLDRFGKERTDSWMASETLLAKAFGPENGMYYPQDILALARYLDGE